MLKAEIGAGSGELGAFRPSSCTHEPSHATTSDPPTSGNDTRHRWIRWAVCVLALGFGAGLVAYVFRAPLLTGLANAWVVNEPVDKADAIVVLGGGIENRPFAAAKLYRDGVAPLVVYLDVKAGPAEELGLVLSETEVTRRVLLSNGVPDTAMLVIGREVSSTYEESQAVREWAQQAAVRSLLIPTDLFHTRRVRGLFERQLRGTPVQIHVQAVDPIGYRATNWWQHENGLIAFQNEVVKSIYYRVKY